MTAAPRRPRCPASRAAIVAAGRRTRLRAALSDDLQIGDGGSETAGPDDDRPAGRGDGRNRDGIDGYGKAAMCRRKRRVGTHRALARARRLCDAGERLGEAKAIVPSSMKQGRRHGHPAWTYPPRPYQRGLCAQPFRRHGGGRARRAAGGRDPVCAGDEQGPAHPPPHGRTGSRGRDRRGRAAVGGFGVTRGLILNTGRIGRQSDQICHEAQLTFNRILCLFLLFGRTKLGNRQKTVGI